MNCETYLSMLATLPIDELTHSDARAHVATCRDCDRVSRVVAEREHNMLMAFGELYPPTPADPIASRALEVSRRRRLMFFSRMGVGVIAVAGLLSMIVVRRAVPPGIAAIRETFRLQCLSPEQAAEIVRPVSLDASIYVGPSPVGIIRVTAPPATIARVRALIDRYDTPTMSQCGVQLTVPKEIKVP